MDDLSAAASGFVPPSGWQRITTIDAHTAGEPLRLVTGKSPAGLEVWTGVGIHLGIIVRLSSNTDKTPSIRASSIVMTIKHSCQMGRGSNSGGDGAGLLRGRFRVTRGTADLRILQPAHHIWFHSPQSTPGEKCR